jgi:hypothetical protein
MFANQIILNPKELKDLEELAGPLPISDYIAAVLRDHLALAKGKQDPHRLVQQFLDGEADASTTIRGLEFALQEAEKKVGK